MADPEDGAASAPDEAFDASDKDQVDKRKRTAGRRNQRMRQVFEGIVNSSDGREWLFDFLGDMRVFEARIVTGDLYTTAFQAGEREVGLQLQRKLAREFPAQFAQMMKDNDRG